MKKKTILLSLLTLAILTGCSEKTTVQNGGNPIGNVDKDYQTVMDLQTLNENLKTSNGGSKATEVLLDRLFELEYKAGIDSNWSNQTDFSVRKYRTKEAFEADITEHFQDIVDGTSYLDDDGKFDVEAYVKSLKDADEDITEEANSKYASILPSELSKYNFDAYIDKKIVPDLYEKYFYQDYLLGSNKYKGQFANQYGMTFEVLKIDNYTTADNSSWTESMIRDVKAISVGAASHEFSTDYSFVTYNSDNELIVFTSAADKLTYTVYADNEGSNEIVDLIDNLINRTVKKLDVSVPSVAAITTSSNVTASSTWTVDNTTKFDSDYFKKVEELLIARKLYNIDLEVVKAANANQKNEEYQAYTKTEKNTADSALSTYTSSNTYSIKKGAKKAKITAQQAKYYTEEEAYTKANYGNVLPSSITSLRGTTSRELQSNLLVLGEDNYMTHYDVTTSKGYGVADGQNAYLLPYKEGLTSPVYLDSDSYYVCRVSNWYGYYIGNPQNSSAAYKSLSNYQIEAYQNGTYHDWALNAEKTKYVESTTASNTADNKAIVDLIQAAAGDILTSAMRKEAVVDLFKKYNLEINDQEVYDYIKSTYPDYFAK